MLLRDVMKKEGKVAIGKVVLFRKQRLVAIIVRGEYLVLEMLRFDREIITADEMKSLKDQFSGVKINPKELEMATSLVNGMTSDSC
jgi:DNA end-binding protein Ku